MEYDKDKSKAVMFFTGSTLNDMRNLQEAGIKEILVSYHYLTRHKAYFLDFIRDLYSEGGLFMADSGSHSFMGGRYKPEMRNESYWTKYLEEYVEFLRDNKDYIYVASNLDLDKLVGKDVVDRWNEKYFRPLEKEGLQIVYVAHESKGDAHALKRFEEYCKKYSYVGINKKHKAYTGRFYQIAKLNKARIHGFSFSSYSGSQQYPFHSMESNSWNNGNKYGTTFIYDGRNFSVYNYTRKHIRKQYKVAYEKAGIKWSDIEAEDRGAITKMNLLAFKGFRKDYVKAANLKLNCNFVGKYLVGKNKVLPL